ncbi:hypothetical protein [Microbacterium sp.]|uniref:capsular polysaccharide export protein, LipB/KpsS family n=1 Tax=Microbacterium sp. TaxID=51671 RepID=UPI003A9554ED
MRIAFIETRDKTELFQAVADRLPGEVFWLIQNAAFVGSGKRNVTVMKYPRRGVADAGKVDDAQRAILDRVRQSDRTGIYFGRDDWHYSAYYLSISKWFDEVRPDVIFGEPGSFWTHMVALIAARRGVPFLNPLSSRYPTGRFAFFQSDRLTPFRGEGVRHSQQDLQRIVDDIVSGRERPDYMSSRRSPAAAFRARLALLREWVRGERFTAQSPVLFVRSALRLKAARRKWDVLAAEGAGRPTVRKVVLYPLQLQPEMNLDVWGYEYRDQSKLVANLADRFADENVEVWVKPNPKSFYELSDDLLQVVSSRPNVRVLSHSVKMSEVVDQVALVVTVTGSVAIERLLAEKPVLVLQEDYARWIGATPPTGLALDADGITLDAVLSELSEAQRPKPVEVIERLISTSYRGVISEPTYMPGVLEPANVDRLVAAFNNVLLSIAPDVDGVRPGGG